MKTLAPFLTFVCLVVASSLLVRPAHAEPETVSLNFVNADIESVVKAVGLISGRNFLIDPRVKGTLNIVSAKPVPSGTTYSILLSALRLQGYTAIESGGVTKIVPEADAKSHAMPVLANEGRPIRGDQLVTQVFALRNESAAQLVPVLRPMISPNNTISAYPANNTLVVTDYAENLGRISRVIEAIDRAPAEVVVIPLKHASAIELAPVVSRLLADSGPTVPGGGDVGQRIVLYPDARSNSLLARSESPAKLAALRQLVDSLDQTPTNGTYHVVYLKNAEAARVAQTLRAVLTADTAATPSTGGAAMAPMNGSTVNGNSAAAGVTPGIVQADVANNALIITAPEATYQALRRVVDMLDRRRAQVYVEALIAEVSADRAAEIGIQWQSAHGIGAAGNAAVVGGTNFGTVGQNILATAANPATIGTGLNVMVAKGTVTLPGIGEVVNLNLLARFLESETKANILSTPNLVTLDNEEAQIVIGQNLPFVTGQYSNTGGGTTPANPFQTIERKDVGLTLRIKPQISEGGVIKLQIMQEASSVLAATIGATAGPVTNKRALESTVLADDGAIIALGGLVQDTYESGEEKVPLLGDIPFLGALFRYETRKRTKTNLMIFLRPKILRDRQDYAGVTVDRYDYLLGEQLFLDPPAKLLSGEAPPPRLPELPAAEREALVPPEHESE